MEFSPLFIIGVPRSGTTLLRVLLDSHSEVAALPESPWLLGAYGYQASLREMIEGIVEGQQGIVRNVAGTRADDVYSAARAFLAELFEPILQQRKKRLLVFKTPDDIPFLDFLVKLFPNARYIHVIRDGRDAALSQLAKKGKFFQNLGDHGQLSYGNTLRRWAEWEQRIRDTLYRDGIRVIPVRYEDLVTDPRRELERVTEFLEIAFEPSMLDYASTKHDYPGWEAGSTDVARRNTVSDASVGTWRRTKLTAEMADALMKFDSFLVRFGYPSSKLSLTLGQRASAALYGTIQPVLDGAAALVRGFCGWLRGQISGILGTIATIAMILLGAQMLAPQSVLQELHLAGPIPQALLGTVAVLCFEATFWPSLLRRSTRPRSNLPTVLKAMLFIFGYVGLLELARIALVGTAPGLAEPATLAAIVILVTAATLLPLRWAQQRLWPA